jgi:signal transduction histidine kinase
MPQQEPLSGAVIAQRVVEEHQLLARRWLDRLRPLVNVEPHKIFPSQTLLDHIPELITRIGTYLGNFDHDDIVANSAVVAKAQELGELRFDQKASVHQILREYELLDGVLTNFVKDEIASLGLRVTPAECIDLTTAIGRAIAVLRGATIDAFLVRHTDTITSQAKQIESFNRMVTHELRQPLSVLSNVTYLLDKVASERTVDKFEILSRNVSRIIDITRQLERIARIQATSDNPLRQEVNLAAAARAAARQLREMSDAKGVEVQVDPGLPGIVTESARLELILINLLSNAIKYSDPGKAERFVEVRTVPDGRPGWCSFMIRDNGIGVPRDRVDTIFGPFVRAHKERDTELDVYGMGLGLSIVRECISAIGGTIAVESAESRGTSFVISLPAV